MATRGAYNQNSDSGSQTSLLNASSGDCWRDHGRPAVRSNRQWTSGSGLGFLRNIDAILTQYFHRPVRRRLNVGCSKGTSEWRGTSTKESKIVSTETAPVQKTEGTEWSETCMTQNDGHFRSQWYVFLNFSLQSALDFSHF